MSLHNNNGNRSNHNRPSWSFVPSAPSRRGSKSAIKDDEDEGHDRSLCWFCQEEPAAVAVKIPHPRFPKRDKISRSYCLKHYYSTPVARTVPLEDVEVVDPPELDRQLGPMQAVFAEAFTQLQAELTEEAARAFASQQDDPLALLHNLNQSQQHPIKKKRKPSLKRPPRPATTTETKEGGFLRSVPLPERLVRTQQQQAQLQQDMVDRMDRAAAVSRQGEEALHRKRKASASSSVSKRRTSSRKSIWNTVLDNPTTEGDAPKQPQVEMADTTCSTCGSTKVELLGSNTSRNQDLKKGETWGVKDRDNGVVARLQCQSCGKLWTEEL